MNILHIWFYKQQSNLPSSEAGRTHQMTTGFNSDVFVILCTDLAQLKGATNLAVEFVLFLWRAVVIGHIIRWGVVVCREREVCAKRVARVKGGR